VNNNINTAYTIDQDTLIAQTFELFEQYTITGIVEAVGGVHAAIPSALGDENERFTQRLLHRSVAGGAGMGGDPTQGWINAYGWTGSGNADHRYGGGLEGGFDIDVSDKLRIGFGASRGTVNLDLDNGTGSAGTDLTELGLYATWQDNGLYLNLAGVAGLGTVQTDGLDTIGSYNASLVSLAGEAGQSFLLDEWRLTPHLGYAAPTPH
jgi:outer membrane autotransporter protein